jgi:hypothetical protein
VVAEAAIGWALTAALPKAANVPRRAIMRRVERMDYSIEIERRASRAWFTHVAVTIARASQPNIDGAGVGLH